MFVNAELLDNALFAAQISRLFL